MAAIHAAAMTLPRPWSTAEMTALLGLPGAIQIDGEAAFVLGRVTLDEAELLTIAVHPTRQGKGLGRACLTRFHARASHLGATTSVLEVAQTNAAARALYASAQYVEVGRRPNYYGPGVDALVLRRDLDP